MALARNSVIIRTAAGEFAARVALLFGVARTINELTSISFRSNQNPIEIKLKLNAGIQGLINLAKQFWNFSVKKNEFYRCVASDRTDRRQSESRPNLVAKMTNSFRLSLSLPSSAHPDCYDMRSYGQAETLFFPNFDCDK